MMHLEVLLIRHFSPEWILTLDYYCLNLVGINLLLHERNLSQSEFFEVRFFIYTHTFLQPRIESTSGGGYF